MRNGPYCHVGFFPLHLVIGLTLDSRLGIVIAGSIGTPGDNGIRFRVLNVLYPAKGFSTSLFFNSKLYLFPRFPANQF